MERTVEQSSGIQVISLIGAQGTGKSTLAQRLAEHYSTQFIEASSVVRELYGDLTRDQMPETNIRTVTEPTWLGDAIYERIQSPLVFLAGVREVEVHDTLLDKQCTVQPIKLWAPEQERYARLKALGKCDTWLQFKEHGQNEMSIGLGDLLDEPYPTYITCEYVSIDDVKALIVKELDEGFLKGVVIAE